MTELNEKKNIKSELRIGTMLDFSNYGLWCFDMVPMLLDEGLAEQIEGKMVFKEGPKSTRAIQQNVGPEVKPLLMNCRNATQMWETLTKRFSGVDKGRKLRGIKSVASFACTDAKMSDNIHRLEQTVRELKVAVNNNARV
jgi:hypothetical protein